MAQPSPRPLLSSCPSVNPNNYSTEGHGPFWEQPTVQEKLRAIAAKSESDPGRQADSFQEAWIHLWRKERERPGQSLSWYLQSCRFYLAHLKNRGRSLDSPKRAAAHNGAISFTFQVDGTEDGSIPAGMICDDATTEICAGDLLETLSGWLRARDKDVLKLCSQGFGTCEIANHLALSPKTVIKSRRRIASLMERVLR